MDQRQTRDRPETRHQRHQGHRKFICLSLSLSSYGRLLCRLAGRNCRVRVYDLDFELELDWVWQRCGRGVAFKHTVTDSQG